MGRTFTDRTDHSHTSDASKSSAGSHNSIKNIKTRLSRFASNHSSRRESIVRDQKANVPSATAETKPKDQEDGYSNLLEREKDAWKHQTVLMLGGGQQSHPVTQLFILKALMAEITKLEKTKNNAYSSFDSPLILSERAAKREKEDPYAAVSSEEMDNPEDAGYLPCHYFDFTGGTSTGGLIAILLGRLRMTVDETVTTYEQLAPFRESYSLPMKRRASNNESQFRSCLDTTIKKAKIRPSGTMVKKAPISTKMASGPYMCKTFLNPSAGSRINLDTCNAKNCSEEEITNAAYDVLNGQRQPPLKRKTNPFKSAFLMSITRVSPKEREVYSLGKFYKKNIPSFMDPDASLSPREDILSLLEERQSTDEKARSLLRQIRNCAEYLVEKRQRRAQTANWERFALGTDYRCGYCVAKGREKPYDQYLLIEHLQKEHRVPPSDDDRFDTYCEILRHFRTEAVA